MRELRKKSSKKSTVPFLNTHCNSTKISLTWASDGYFPCFFDSERVCFDGVFFAGNVIMANAIFQLPNASLTIFVLLESKMHTTWLWTVGGKLKSGSQYSNTLVYNTFPIPPLDNLQQGYLDRYAKLILSARKENNSSETSLASLYDPVIMPAISRIVHVRNDKFVDFPMVYPPLKRTPKRQAG
ncbi:type IIL restriction-modification enzyme MmeI [Lacticaseibacillus paracasei]|uniref:type IIL restriction-modification enzyme MmeI n=1 Tax=Lacticaseibacillus paracasei TaxID=1597 RepID=UPI002FF50F78